MILRGSDFQVFRRPDESAFVIWQRRDVSTDAGALFFFFFFWVKFSFDPRPRGTIFFNIKKYKIRRFLEKVISPSPHFRNYFFQISKKNLPTKDFPQTSLPLTAVISPSRVALWLLALFICYKYNALLIFMYCWFISSFFFFFFLSYK
jgi:hypothetical protein